VERGSNQYEKPDTDSVRLPAADGLFTGSPIKAKDPKYQPLVDRTLKKMVFVEGGSYTMGDPGDELVQAYGDQAFKYYLPCQDNKPARNKGESYVTSCRCVINTDKPLSAGK
jgi:hypothetical protein